MITLFKRIVRLMLLQCIKFTLWISDLVERIRSHRENVRLLEGGVQHQTSNYAIIVVYQHVLRDDTRILINALNRASVNCILCLTKTPRETDLNWLTKNGYRIILGCRYGRDFGAYKKATLLLIAEDKIPPTGKLIYLNDSVFYSQDGIDQLTYSLIDPKHEVIAASQNYDVHRHLGSFAISVGGETFNHPAFKKFWFDYKLTNIRPKIISTGEHALSDVLFLINGHRIKIIYSTDALYSEFCKKNDIVSFYNNKRRAFLIGWPSTSYLECKLKYLKEVSSVLALDIASGKREEPTEVYNGLEASLIRLDSDREFHNFAVSTFWEEANIGSQIHQNATLYRVFLRCPIVKLDLYYRGVLNFQDLMMLIKTFPENEQNDLIQLILARAPGERALARIDRLKFQFGYI